MQLTLLGHSGFLVEGDTACLVFDCYTDELGLVGKLPFGRKKVLFFASHAHSDHYNRKILNYADAGEVAYVLGHGIAMPRKGAAVILGKGQSTELLGIPVRAFGSTDTGVSFLLELEGKRLFHAGDLNDWYWEDESTAEELAHDEQWFLDEIAPLADSAPDVAFFPVDARLGKHAIRGALHFARAARPAVIVPMHLSGGKGLPWELNQRLAAEGLDARAAQITRPGDSITI